MNTYICTCMICHKQIGHNGMAAHVKRTHKLSSTKEYFDTYFIGPINKCLWCGKDTKFLNILNGYRKYCSQDCARRHTLELTKLKYNVSNISQVKEVSNRMKNSIHTNWINLSEEEYISRCQAISNGTKTAMIEVTKNRYNDIQQYCISNNMTTLSDLVDIYGTGFLQTNILDLKWIKYKNKSCLSNDQIDKIIEYNNMSGRSKHETYIYNLVKLYYDDTVMNKRILNGKELDIYIPSIKLGIEYNGFRFHSIENGKSKDYHLKKSLLCREKGIRLIHIYEFEDFKKQMQLLIDLLEGNDNYAKDDFNKNNLISNIPQEEIIYKTDKCTIYGAGKLYNSEV